MADRYQSIMKFILGKKIEMTQKFGADGALIPVTVVQAGPCVITQVKDQDTDGYTAVQVGFATKKSLTKPQKGHVKGLGEVAFLREFRVAANETGQFERGQQLTVDVFAKGDVIAVTGTSKGKGFQGVVKRHGFKGAPKTHGNKDQLRMPGSLGAGEPQHVFKGMRMGGRTGGDQVTVHNLVVVDVDPAQGLIYIKGAVPGHRHSLVEMYGDGAMQLAKPAAAQAAPAEAPAAEAAPAAVTAEATAAEQQ